jgi:hypothetical protein
MTDKLLEFLLSNSSSGPSALLLGLLLLLFFYGRRDALAHRNDMKEMNEQLMDIVKNNTESMTRLTETIRDLRLSIDQSKK